jgi:hypothetical protein
MPGFIWTFVIFSLMQSAAQYGWTRSIKATVAAAIPYFGFLLVCVTVARDLRESGEIGGLWTHRLMPQFVGQQMEELSTIARLVPRVEVKGLKDLAPNVRTDLEARLIAIVSRVDSDLPLLAEAGMPEIYPTRVQLSDGTTKLEYFSVRVLGSRPTRDELEYSVEISIAVTETLARVWITPVGRDRIAVSPYKGEQSPSEPAKKTKKVKKSKGQ